MKRRRSGFTLVEMLVALALILFIMAILSEAFVAGLDSFRQLKSVGDMNEKLRGAVSLIRNDLHADHFNDQPLSKQQLPPTEGFFRLFQGSPPIDEGADADGIHSYRAADHMMHFTVNLKATSTPGLTPNSRENFLSAPVAGSPLLNYSPAAYQDGVNYLSQWAEVAYFVRPTGASTTGKQPLPLYNLYRRQLLAYVPVSGLPSLNLGLNRVLNALAPLYPEVSAKQDPLNLGFLFFNTPGDLTIPVRRFGMRPTLLPLYALQPENAGLLTNGTYPVLGENPGQAAYEGTDLLLTDVVSFEVRIMTSGDFINLFDASLQNLIQNPAFRGANNPRVFDTWSKKLDPFSSFAAPIWNTPNTYKSIPLNVSVKAIQITLRVWDVKTQRTRQVTLVQDM